MSATIREIGQIPQSTSDGRARAIGMQLVVAIILFATACICRAQSDLLRMIPPDAPVIAGMRRLPPDQARDALWLATKNNTDDLNQMIAATEADPERRVDEVVAADWPSASDGLGNHLVVATGRFNLTPLTAPASASGSELIIYAGVPVIAMKTNKGGERWLAAPRHDLAVFGAPGAVRYALDRDRSGAVADMTERLKNVPVHDAAWSSVRLDARRVLSRVSFPSGGDDLLRCLGGIREVDLGIRLGTTVKIDLYTDAARGDGRGVSTGCLATAFFGTGRLHKQVVVAGDQQDHLRVSLIRADYDQWLDSFRYSRVNQILMAMIASPETAGAQGSHGTPAP